MISKMEDFKNVWIEPILKKNLWSYLYIMILPHQEIYK